MDIDNVTIGQVKELVEMFGKQTEMKAADGLNCMVGSKVIVRTYSAGVWFGMLGQKSGNEVILKEARRMYRWQAAESISLSPVSIYGIDQSKSKICEGVPSVWLEAIEIIPCSIDSIRSIEGAKNVEAE